MFNLEKLRAKSDGSKKMIAGFGAGAITLVIAGIWASTLPARFSDIGGSKQTAAVESALDSSKTAKDSTDASAPSPLDALKQQFVNFQSGANTNVKNPDSNPSQNLDNNSASSDYSGAVIISDPVLDSASNSDQKVIQ